MPTNLDELEFKSLLLECKNYTEMAKRLGVSRQAVHIYAQRRGWLKSLNKDLKLVKKQRVEVFADCAPVTAKSFSEELGVSIQTARVLARSYGIELKRPTNATCFDELSGQFGDWTILCRDPAPQKDPGIHYLCRCACGCVRSVTGRNLRDGRSSRCQSCACKLRETRLAESRKNAKQS